MLLQLILALAATAANAFVIPQNITTGSVQPLYERTPLPPHVPGLHIPVTDNELNTYSASDMAIFLKAHNQALDMCAMVIDQATRETRRFDRIFRRWFAEEDRQKVLDVFMDMGGSTSGMLGHPEFDDIEVIDDIKDEKNPNGVCDRGPMENGMHLYGHTAFSGRTEPGVPEQEDAFILCPNFFKRRALPTKRGASCQKFGDNLVDKMFTAASMLVHEYAHFDKITHRALGEGTIDQPGGYGVEGASKLDKAKAVMNADSYAWLATELAWSVRCKRKYVYPPLDKRASYPPHDQNLHIPNPDHEDNLSTPLEIAPRTSVRVSPKQ